jgi:hypothetical protein
MKEMFNYRAPLITQFCFPTGSFSQLLRYQNTHLSMLNSVFGALYLKKIPALVFQNELIEVPYMYIGEIKRTGI